jgi:hypothetical protein
MGSASPCPRQITELAGWGVCPAPFAKIFPFPFDANHRHISRHPGPHRGAFRDRHGRRARDAVDAACQKTNDVARGRQSRVVLTPRRWRQVGGRHFRRRRWQESPVTGESTK